MLTGTEHLVQGAGKLKMVAEYGIRSLQRCRFVEFGEQCSKTSDPHGVGMPGRRTGCQVSLTAVGLHCSDGVQIHHSAFS